MKVTRNFSFEKLRKSQALSEWLNQYGNRINKSIQDGLDQSIDIYGKRFESGGEFTHKSVHDGQAHKRPLVRSGRLRNSVRKLPSTIKKLSFTITEPRTLNLMKKVHRGKIGMNKYEIFVNM